MEEYEKLIWLLLGEDNCKCHSYKCDGNTDVNHCKTAITREIVRCVKESMTHDAVLGEVLKIINNNYIDVPDWENPDITMIGLMPNDVNKLLNKIKKEILSIFT